MTYLIPFFFFLGFTLIWLLMISLFFFLGSWRKLLIKYGHPNTPEGTAINWTSITINKGVRFQRSIHITVAQEGLHIRAFKVFEWVWHKPLLIPWDEMTSIEEGEMIFANYYTIYLKDGTKMHIAEKVKKAMDKAGIRISS